MPTDNSPAEISFEDFTLPFIPEVQEEPLDEETEQEPLTKRQQLRKLQEHLPEEAIYLGRLSNEIAHSPGLTWEPEDHYYLVPWKEPGFDWAMFRITWDDNWEQYEWNTDARINGVKDPKAAACQLFQALLEKWNIDLEDEENEAYARFLGNLTN